MTLRPVDPVPDNTIDVSGTHYITGVTTFECMHLIEVMTVIVEDGLLGDQFEKIVMHPHVLNRYLMERFPFASNDFVPDAKGIARNQDGDTGTMLGIPIYVDRDLMRGVGVYETQVHTNEGKIGVLVTREG